MFDYLIVGYGVRWGVLAERLASQSVKKILIIDTRAHIGGNAYDHYDAAGILVRYKYGIFHTNSARYSTSRTSRNGGPTSTASWQCGRSAPAIPINLDTVHLYGLSLTSFQVEVLRFCCWAERYIRTSEDVCEQVGRELYEVLP